MNTLTICIAAAAIGFNAGWQRLPQGGMEYIIQLDPASLDALRAGQPLGSDVPPNVRDVRSWRIVIGAEPLRRDAPPEKPKTQPEKPKAELKTPTAEKPKTPPEPAKPWLPMTLTLFGLFGSLAANVFLGWITMGLRERCRQKMVVA